jgi:SAM-dependent methyltransferase
VRDFVPVLFTDLNPTIFDDGHVSNALAPDALELIEATDGLVLNLSAGGSERWHPRVIEAEAAIFRNTDVVANAHKLPFMDNIFSAVIAMNAFEHYDSPHVAAREIYRVLRPGGKVLIHTAFLQPLHEPPYHFYNCTEFGLRNWFKNFERANVKVPANFNPVYGLAMQLSTIDWHLRYRGRTELADRIRALTIGHLVEFWDMRGTPEVDTTLAAITFQEIPSDLQMMVSAGFELIAYKPR